MRRALLSLFTALGLTLPAAAQTQTGADFVDQAAAAGKFEIASSRVALRRSKDPQVKSFASQMIADHTKAAKMLTVTAKGEGIPVREVLTAPQAKQLKQLREIGAKDFDAAYVADQVSAHNEAVALFSGYANGGDDPKLKTFAAETLPTLQQHLQHATMLQQAK